MSAVDLTAVQTIPFWRCRGCPTRIAGDLPLDPAERYCPECTFGDDGVPLFTVYLDPAIAPTAMAPYPLILCRKCGEDVTSGDVVDARQAPGAIYLMDTRLTLPRLYRATDTADHHPDHRIRCHHCKALSRIDNPSIAAMPGHLCPACIQPKPGHRRGVKFRLTYGRSDRVECGQCGWHGTKHPRKVAIDRYVDLEDIPF